MPYAIATDKPDSRKFQARTLNTARAIAHRLMHDETNDRLRNSAWNLPRDGGTIGPLTDGTTITISRNA